MMGIVYDARFALRTLRRRPGFLLAVVLTLALGIGANTAVFSIVQALILRPLPVTDPDRLVAIFTSTRETPYGGSPFALYQELAPKPVQKPVQEPANHNSGLAGLISTAAYMSSDLELSNADPARDVSVALVTDNYFSVLGVRAAIGRTMQPDDSDDPGANPVVVLSARFWRQRFGGDRSVIGHVMHINSQPVTVIGVAPDRFRGTDLSAVPDLWMPVSMVTLLKMPLLSEPGGVNPDIPFFSIFARLSPGVDSRQVTAEAAAAARRVDWSSPFTGQAGKQPSVSVIPLNEAASSMRGRDTLLHFVRILVSVGALALVLACLNVANLLMVRAGERARELGVRAALGARARRLAQQLFTESVMLAVLGGAVGIAVAIVTLRALSSFTLPGGIVVDRVDLGLHPRVLIFACGMSLLTAIAFGLIPAVRASRVNVVDVLRNREGSAPAVRRRSVLLAIQVAISLVLLVGTGLLLRSIRASLTTGIGFDPHSIAAVSVVAKNNGTRAGNNSEYMSIVTEVEHAPGVNYAAVSTHVPLAPSALHSFAAGPLADSTASYAVGAAASGGGQAVPTGVNHIMGDYFKAMGVPLVAGRAFSRQDVAQSQPVVILNEAAARALWPHDSPIGKRVHGTGAFGPIWFGYTVIGVVRDTKYTSLQDNNLPFAYVPMTQQDYVGGIGITFIARSSYPRDALATLQRAVASIGPELKTPKYPGFQPRLVSDQIDMLIAPQRLAATLLSGFALLALCISGVGIDGTVSYVTSRRTTEIGIRMALGAQSAEVLSLILSETAAAVAVGIGLGVAGAALTTKFLTQWLYNVGSFDPFSFGAAIVVVALMSAVAALAPSWRAIRIDPVQAIKTAE